MGDTGKEAGKRKTVLGGARRNRLGLRIAIITIFSSLAGVAGIMRVNANMQRVQESYRRIMDEDYANVSYMHAISRKLQQHQLLVITHLLEEDADARTQFEQGSQQLEVEIRELLVPFGENLRGGRNESYYHNIYSGMVGYFKNIEIVYSFRNRGDVSTASHYMRTSLQENISSVNDNMELLNSLLEKDMDVARAEIEERSAVSLTESIVILALVAGAAVLCVVLCTKLSDEIAGKDLLTGVANFDRLMKQGEKLEKKGRLAQYSAIALSIRNFKYINREYGSNAGDAVLKQYALKLARQISGGELVARNGGDNFILLVHKERVRDLLKSVQQIEVELPEEGRIQLVSRCGIYDAKEGDSISTLLDSSTLALNDARKQGDTYQLWFDNSMLGAMLERKEILNRYQHALSREEFLVYYQPKVDMRDGRLVGCEALVRWIRDGQLVPPIDFIPVLEAEGSITVLDFYVLERVCRDIRNWLDMGLEAVKVSSNFSKLHLRSEGFAEKILNIMDRYNIDGRYIEVELTESSGYEDFDALKSFVDTMKLHGVSTSIDDFGTGYSSLSLLKDLDVDVVKLDRSFLFGLERGDNLTSRLIANVVRMIHDLNRKVICEGVETKQHVDFLSSVGCHFAQGFYYDKALPHDDFEQRLFHPVYAC